MRAYLCFLFRPERDALRAKTTAAGGRIVRRHDRRLLPPALCLDAYSSQNDPDPT
jgi:hypothetical protein